MKPFRIIAAITAAVWLLCGNGYAQTLGEVLL